MASTALPTAIAARLGVRRPIGGRSSRSGLAFSAFCFTLAAISSIEAEASSVAEACSVDPCDSCSAEADSSWLPADTLRAAAVTWPTTSRSFTTMRPMARWRSPISSCPRAAISCVRSPAATASAIRTEADSPREIDKAIHSAMASPASTAAETRTTIIVRVDS